MEWRTLTLADALQVALTMREQDRHCLEVVTGITSPETFALNRWQTDGAAWTLVDEGRAVAMGGVQQIVPWVGTVWMASSVHMRPASWKKLVRHGRIVLHNAAKAIPRVECHVLSTWAEAKTFADKFGFVLEGVRHRAGREGQDILTFVYQGKA